MLRCNRGQSDFQRWMVRYEIARQKAVGQLMPGWTSQLLEPDIAGAPVQGSSTGRSATTSRSCSTSSTRRSSSTTLRAEARQTYIGAPDGLEAHVNAVAPPAATEAMSVAAIETVWESGQESKG